MPRQSERYALDLNVQLYASHQWQAVAMQDVSRTGMFVAMSPPLPVGTPVIVALKVDGVRVSTPARVANCLEDGRAIGRVPGVGIAFRMPLEPAFALAVDQLLRRVRAKQQQQGARVVVADAEPRMLERLSDALAAAGFSVATAATGMEVFGACLQHKPDVVLVDRKTPIIDGMQLIERLAGDDKLASVPLVVMTSEPRDIEPAFEHGAADVVLKPFSMVEMIARIRRIAQAPRRGDPSLLSGSLASISVGTVLTMLEQENKTNRLLLSNGHAAWIDVVDGRVVDAGWSVDNRHPRAVVLEILDWAQGTFKVIASPPRRRSTSFAMPIMQLLLEQARLRDEAARPISARTATS